MAMFNRKVVLFGGSTGSANLGDTWEWDGNTWIQRNVPGPAARSYAAMATLNGKVVLFGGHNGSVSLADTWEWDGNAWTQRNPSAPPPSHDHAMATLNDKVVLVGGSSQPFPGATVFQLQDTWEWSGATWTLRSGARAFPRYGHTMTTLGGGVVLFGGIEGLLKDDTWVWDGATWTETNRTQGASPRYAPSARAGCAMATLNGKAILFGGAASSRLSDTWEWDGTRWSGRNVVGPSWRSRHAMATFVP